MSDIQQPGKNIPEGKQPVGTGTQSAIHSGPIRPPPRPVDRPLSSAQRLPDFNQMQRGTRPKAPVDVSQSTIRTGGNQNVSHPSGGAIPKQDQSTRKPLSETSTTSSGIQRETQDREGKTDTAKEPPQSSQTGHPTIPQNRYVVTQLDVSSTSVRRIMEQLGKAHSTIGQAERSQAYRQLYDLVIRVPIFFSLDDIPVTRDWKTDIAKQVFSAANNYKERQFHQQQEKARQTDTTQKGRQTSTTEESAQKPFLSGSTTGSGTASGTDQSRPTRSNTKAPDIPPTPPVSLERQLKRHPK
jgi:hypothetical protein